MKRIFSMALILTLVLVATFFTRANVVQGTMTHYIAYVSQFDANAPTVSEKENSLGQAVTWTRVEAGHYRMTVPNNLFLSNNTRVITSFGEQQPNDAPFAYRVFATRISAKTIDLFTQQQIGFDPESGYVYELSDGVIFGPRAGFVAVEIYQ